MLDNKLNCSITVLESIKNDNNWSGAASNTFNESLTDLILSINKEISNLEKFQDALNILEEIKSLDSKIVKLQNSIVDISIDADQETILQNTETNALIRSSINQKTNEKNSLREKAITILSSFGIVSEINIIELDGVKDLTVLQSYDMGCICEFTMANGQKYEAYVPYKVDPVKPIIVYDSGGYSNITTDTSGYEWEKWNAYFKEHGFDHIMLRSTRSDNSLYYADLCEKLNLKPDSRLFISWSGGFKRQFEEYYDLSTEQGSSPGVLAIMDSYVINDKKYIDKCKEDGTILLCFYENNINHPAHESYFGAGEENLNMLIFRDISEFGNSHGGIRDSLYDNNVIDYLTGNGDLPDNYVISYYNPSDSNADSRGYVTVDRSEVKTLDDVYNFFGVKK